MEMENVEKLKKKLAAFEKLTSQLMVENNILKDELDESGKDLSKLSLDKNSNLVKEVRKAVGVAMDDGLKDFSFGNNSSINNISNSFRKGDRDSIIHPLSSNGSIANIEHPVVPPPVEHEPVMISLMSGDEISLFHEGK